MREPFFRIDLRLLPTAHGGRAHPVGGEYRPNWDLGNTWLGEPMIHDGRVFLDDARELAPGAAGPARIEPVRPEFWGRVREGAVLPVQEGARVVGFARIVEVVAPAYWSPEVAAFVLEARQFSAFIEQASGQPLEQRLVGARERLLALYEAATRLPDVEPPDGIDAGPTPARPSTWRGFETFETYWEVFDPYEESAPVGGSLSDDLLDVHGDVQRGLALWDREGASRIAAIWEWRFHFDTHWGEHAVDALRALHRACRRW